MFVLSFHKSSSRDTYQPVEAFDLELCHKSGEKNCLVNVCEFLPYIPG